MSVWVLKPEDMSKESWRGSRTDLARVVVVADSEQDARKIAASSMLVNAKTYDKTTPPIDRTTELSPWQDHGASSCKAAEKFDDPIIAIEVHGMRG